MKLLALVALLLAVVAMTTVVEAWKMDQQIYITGSFVHAKEELIIKAVAREDINCDDEAPGTFFVTENVIDVAGSSFWSLGDNTPYPSTFEDYIYPNGRNLDNTFVEHGIAVCDGSSAVPQFAGDKRVEKYVLSVSTVELPPIRETDDITVAQYEEFIRRDAQMRGKARSICREEFGPDYDLGTNFELLAFVKSNGPVEDWDLPIVGRRPGVLAFTAENSVTFQSLPVWLESDFGTTCPNPMSNGDWLEFAQARTITFHANNVESIAFDLADGIGFQNAYSCNNLFCSLDCNAGSGDFPLDGNNARHYDFYVPGYAQENNPTESRTLIYPNRAPVFCVHKRAPVQSADFSEYMFDGIDEYNTNSNRVCAAQGVGMVSANSLPLYSNMEGDSFVRDPHFELTSAFGWITSRAEPKKFYHQYFDDDSTVPGRRGPFAGDADDNEECYPNAPPAWNWLPDVDGDCDSENSAEYPFARVGCTTATPFDANYDEILD